MYEPSVSLLTGAIIVMRRETDSVEVVPRNLKSGRRVISMRIQMNISLGTKVFSYHKNKDSF